MEIISESMVTIISASATLGVVSTLPRFSTSAAQGVIGTILDIKEKIALGVTGIRLYNARNTIK